MVLAVDPDKSLLHADRESAIRIAMLRAVFTPADAKGIDGEVDRLRAERSRVLGGSACLVIRCRGEIAVDPLKVAIERDGYRFGFDILNKDDVRRISSTSVSAVIAGIRPSLPDADEFLKVADSIYAVDGSGNAIYTSNPKAAGNLTVSHLLSPEHLAGATLAIAPALNAPALERVWRLLSDASNPELDRLRRFLSAWTGLEVMTHKLFKECEERLYAQLASVVPAGLPPVIHRIRDVMKDKYRLSDRFAIVSSYLSPATVDADTKVFNAAKKLRNELTHGEEVQEESLPLETVRNLLSVYTRLAVGGGLTWR